MSVATEFAPVVYIPSAARQPERRPARVIALVAPSEQSIAPPLRLTRRGVQVVAAVVGLLSAALVLVAWLSAPSAAATSSAGAAHAPVTIAVRSGDTLWSIASRVAPNRDPRVEVAALQRINHLAGVELAVGQVLLTK